MILEFQVQTFRLFRTAQTLSLVASDRDKEPLPQNAMPVAFRHAGPEGCQFELPLEEDQIWFVDKDNEGGSFIYPLTDYKPRKEESLLRGYLSGRYGALPFIPAGLLPNVGNTEEDVDASR